MSDSVITVKGLSKQYRIGEGGGKFRYKSFRDALSNVAAAPLRMFRADQAPKASNGNTFWALKDVNFEVHPGEVIGIIGRNGAGKSTLLKILSRITEPTSGEVEIIGRVGSLLEVGTGFHPELTGRENIYLNGAILGMKHSEIERKFDEIVAFAETEKFLDTPVKFYSSGMYTRLAFAVAAHLEPEILIVDEVLAVGDAQFQKKCMGRMGEVAREGRTVLFVSHNLGAVRQLCTSALCLHQGEIAHRGGVAETLSAYAGLLEKPTDAIVDVRGRGKVKVESVQLRVGGIAVDSVASGEDAEIAFKVQFAEGISGPLQMGIALENPYGGFVMVNYSNYQGASFSANSSTYIAKLNRLPLAAGQYQLHLRILVANEEVFWNTRVMIVDVQGGDFFGTGVRSEESLCPWLYQVDWRAD